jgi:long-chain acyl-CoA synthetase
VRAMTADTIPKRLFDHAAARPAAPAYYAKRDGVWIPTGYRLFADQVKRAGKALMALGCEPGSVVAILGFNRPEWVIFDLACMAIGGAAAGIYTTCSSSEVRYIADHAEARVMLVENAAQFEKVRRERANLPHLASIVTMEGASVDDPTALAWDEFLAKGISVSDSQFFARLHALQPENLAALIYTSGTTGPPKGVMLSHANLAWTAHNNQELVGTTPSDSNLSYLPLPHIAEQVITIHGPVTIGSAVYYAESIEKVPENLKEVRPTVFFAVPRIWEKLHAGVSAKMDEAAGAKKRVARWAMSVGRRVSDLRMRGSELPLALKAQHRLAEKLVFSKVKEALGLDRARLCVSGAAPIAGELLEYFASLDLLVLEGYGMSENTGSTTINLPAKARFGSVGAPVPGVEVRIADDGEILMRGPNVFLGYFKEPLATAEAMEDGWLKTGDLGAVDDRGLLTITGRKKEIIITAGGKNIAPRNIEAALRNHPLVSEAVVIGDRRKFLTVLITLDPEAAPRFRSREGSGDAHDHEDPAIVAQVQRALDAVNEELARVEQVKKFRILPRPFSVETGELTPTLKLKRNVVARNFAAEIESMYGG